MRLRLAVCALALPISFGWVVACGTDEFASGDAGADAGPIEAGDARANFCDRKLAADGGLWFCSSFDPPQSPATPYGWDSNQQPCDGGALGKLDNQTYKSEPMSYRTTRNPTCGGFLKYDLAGKGPRRPTIKVAASVLSKDLPLAPGSETILVEASWLGGDAGAPDLFVLVIVKDGRFVLRVARGAAAPIDVDVGVFENTTWHSIEVTANDKTEISVTIDGLTKSTTTPPRPASAPYFYLGPWLNVGGSTSDIYYDDVAIYEP